MQGVAGSKNQQGMVYMAMAMVMSFMASSMSVHPLVMAMGDASASASQASNQSQPFVWPLPSSWSYGEQTLNLSKSFEIKLDDSSVQNRVLSKAIDRYQSLIFPHAVGKDSKVNSTVGHLKKLSVYVSSNDTTLQLGVDESYSLSILPSDAAGDGDSHAMLKANTVWGALRGLETFSQLVRFNFDAEIYQVPNSPWDINDAPRFSHRGLLVDTARHFQPVSALLSLLDSMSYAKFNVLHWHIVDAQSFPVEIPSFPKLWTGSWSAAERYTQADVVEVVEYAYLLGIRVIPEFDGPGHAFAWGIGYPSILPAGFQTLNSSVCANLCPPEYGDPCDVPIDPTNEFTYEVLGGIISDCTGFNSSNSNGPFFDDFFHLGGDEVDTGCWTASPSIAQYMQQHNATYNDLYAYYVTRAHELAFAAGKTPVNWEEVWNYFGTSLDNRTIIHVWLDLPTLSQVVSAGYRGILSNYQSWYLDQLGNDWTVFYLNEPFTNITDPVAQSLVLGGEVCMWGETVDASDLQQTIWPRAAAGAERLWSPRDAIASNSSDLGATQTRLEWFRCLLDQRGVPAAPVTVGGRGAPTGPGSCYLQ